MIVLLASSELAQTSHSTTGVPISLIMIITQAVSKPHLCQLAFFSIAWSAYSMFCGDLDSSSRFHILFVYGLAYVCITEPHSQRLVQLFMQKFAFDVQHCLLHIFSAVTWRPAMHHSNRHNSAWHNRLLFDHGFRKESGANLISSIFLSPIFRNRCLRWDVIKYSNLDRLFLSQLQRSRKS